MTIGDVSVDQFLEVDEQDTSLLCDLHHENCKISFSYGEKIPVKEYHFGFGGSALNTAVGFSRLELKTSIAAVLGDNIDSKHALTFLSKENIDTSASKLHGQTNRSSIILFKGERTIFSYHAPRDYSTLDISDTDWIYFASATEGSQVLAKMAIEKAKGGTRLAFNPGSWQLTHFEHFEPLAKECTVLILNKSEADIIFGNGNIKNQLSKVLSLGAKIAVITDGTNGAYAAAADKFLHLEVFPSKIVDSTGAGDSFSSGVMGGLIYTQSLEESLKWGMLNSSSVIEKIGANEGLMKKSEIIDKLKKVKFHEPTTL